MIGSFDKISGTAINALNQHESGAQKALGRIAAMRAVESTDSANMVIADQLLTQMNSLSQGVQNANEAVGMLQIAESALNTASEGAMQLQELAVQRNSAVLNPSQQAMLDKEASGIVKSIDDAISGATYNGKTLFGSSGEVSLGEGSVAFSIDNLSTDGIDLSNQDSIAEFANSVSSIRGNIGAAVNALDVTIKNSLAQVTNYAAAESQMENNDIVENLQSLNKVKLQQHATTFVIAHNNEMLAKQASYLLG